MKIVIFVDYSSSEFNKDFKLSNMLISRGHNVFLAVNNTQYEGLKKNCDKAVRGFSSLKDIDESDIVLSNDTTIDGAISFIELM